MKAIPTIYKGIQFRSRLEATWAAFFEACGWEWEYEPCLFDGAGWTPDFLLKKLNVLIEVKPQPNPLQWADMDAIDYACSRPIGSEYLTLFVGISPAAMDIQAAPPQDGEPSYQDHAGSDYVPAMVLGMAMLGGDKGTLCPCVGTMDMVGPNGEFDVTCHVLPLFHGPFCFSSDGMLVSTASKIMAEDWAIAKNAVQWRPPGG